MVRLQQRPAQSPSRLVSLGGNYRYDIRITIVTTTGLGNNTAAAGGTMDNLPTASDCRSPGSAQARFSTSPLELLAAPRVAPYKNATLDNVPNGSVAPTKLVVTKAGCQNCHAPDPAIAHGSRYDPKFCAVCHNATLPPDGNLVRLVHKVHSSDNNVVIGTRVFDFSEVAYPQDIRNCTTCHNDTQGSNWKNLPSMEACGSCHTNVNFATGANHIGGCRTTTASGGICHNPDPDRQQPCGSERHALQRNRGRGQHRLFHR